MSTDQTSWMTDPTVAAEAMRDATLQGFDGLISLQSEMLKAIEKQTKTLRAEAEKAVGSLNSAYDETVEASFAASNKFLGWSREQVDRFGRPDTQKA